MISIKVASIFETINNVRFIISNKLNIKKITIPESTERIFTLRHAEPLSLYCARAPPLTLISSNTKLNTVCASYFWYLVYNSLNVSNVLFPTLWLSRIFAYSSKDTRSHRDLGLDHLIARDIWMYQDSHCLKYTYLHKVCLEAGKTDLSL